MKRIIGSVAAYVVASLATQAASHFALAADHYAAVPFMRDAPIMSLGILVMLVQGTLLALAYSRIRTPAGRIGTALGFAWVAGLFLVSYIALVEPAKYAVPSVGSWAAIEATAGFIQFSLYGVLLWLVDRALSAAVRLPAAAPAG